MVKSKMDPLVIIEAKNALVMGGYAGTTLPEQAADKVVNTTTVSMGIA